jgi:transcriptional regulator with XRE-family HTH domain
MQRFGEKLRMLRTRRGMTLRELAEALGYTNHGYLGLLETGKKKPTVEFVLKVARLFQVTTDQLLWDEIALPAAESANMEWKPDAQ